MSLSQAVERTGEGEWELGCRLAKSSWGQGYALEAARALIGRAFSERGIRRVAAIVDPANTRSVALFKRLGMVFESEVMFEGYDHPDHRCILAM